VASAAADINYPVFVVTAATAEAKGGLPRQVRQPVQHPAAPTDGVISKENHTLAVADNVGILAVHALSADQHDVAALFGEPIEAVAGDWRPGQLSFRQVRDLRAGHPVSLH
jgi:flavin reductase (DIM6/NTAB) family NADH-FMN oxidoreductase RutF